VKVFFDTNILLDVLAERMPFYTDSAIVWTFAEEGRFEGLVSALSFSNVFYVLKKNSGVTVARRGVAILRDVFTVVECGVQVIDRAIQSNAIKDFEDAIQCFSAEKAACDCIVTRNPRDFPRAPSLPVMTATKFLATYSFKAATR